MKKYLSYAYSIEPNVITIWGINDVGINCMAIGGFNDYQFKTSCNRVEFEKKLHKKYGTNNKIISFKFVPIADITGGAYLEL